MTKLGLTLNETKTAVQDARREPFDFLGYSFGPHRYRKDGHWYLGRARQRRAYSGSRPGSVTSWFPVTWEHVSDIGHPFISVASFGGSWTFIAMCLAALIAWTAFNSVVRAWQVEPFDPYPYIFLNLILSMLAALQAPIILMSQNRQAARDRLAAGLDYEVNLKAEIEIIELHEKLDQILGEHLDELLRTQREQLQLLTQLTPANSNAR
jgi:uncharacterized membrane protein